MIKASWISKLEWCIAIRANDLSCDWDRENTFLWFIPEATPKVRHENIFWEKLI